MRYLPVLTLHIHGSSEGKYIPYNNSAGITEQDTASRVLSLEDPLRLVGFQENSSGNRCEFRRF